MTHRRSYRRHPAGNRRGASSVSRDSWLSRLMLLIVIIGLIGLTAYAIQRCTTDSAAHPVAITDPQALTYVVTPDDLPQQLRQYEGFALSFNPELHIPNYVVWELTAQEARSSATSRDRAQFAPDDDVEGCAALADYRGSGFDRGHMAPAADMKWSERAMADCHLLTNIAPQTHSLNGGPWKTIEDNCRNWAMRDSAIVIICGPVVTDRLTHTIGENRVAVPDRFFKVVLAPYADPPRGIGFLMSNYDTSGGAQASAVSIDQVEAVTGYDFFSALPDDIEADVEAQCSYSQWQRRRK